MNVAVDQMGRSAKLSALPQRIISLVPSQTELLHDLGLGERVVGITRFCIHPAEWFRTKPRVGGTKKVDMGKVRALKPDLIIGNKEENERADIEALEKEFPVWMSDVRDLPGALDMIDRIGALTGRHEQAVSMAGRIRSAFAGLRPLNHPLTCAYFIWRDPFMVVGNGTFISDMLTRSGLANAFQGTAGHYIKVDPRELAAADPDVILLSSEPYPFAEKHIAEFNMICPATPVFLVDGEMFSWYGSRILRSPEYFNGLLARMNGGAMRE